MQEGILFIVSGPSGSGKTTLTRGVIKMIDNLRFSVSCTTRHLRPGEVDGVDYRFISEREFKEMIQSNKFAEWALVHGHLYGTPIEELQRAKSSGIDLLLDIDTQGARGIKNRYGSGVYIFVTPSSLDVLKERLIKRKGEGMVEITRRLEGAKREMEEIHSYDYIIINDSLDEALENLAAVIRAERCKRERILKSLKTGFGIQDTGCKTQDES
jgi:guanylate kinase